MTWKSVPWPAAAIICVASVALAGCGAFEPPSADRVAAVAASTGRAGDAGAATVPGVLPPQSEPFGATYGGWAARWWTWLLGQPASVNPALDPTGESCAAGQSDHVWFLAGTFGGPAERICTVPASRAILFPVLNGVYCAFLDDPPETRTEEFIRSQVAWVKDATGLFAEIDGRPVDDVERWLEASPLFRVVLPEGNVFGLPAGFVLDPCADAGYYLALPPMAPGAHALHFGGGTDIDVTYHLTVAQPGLP